MTEHSRGQLPTVAAAHFRRLLIITAAVCVPAVLVQLALAIAVTPLFADLYAEGSVCRPPALWRFVFSLSHGPWLALLVLAVDAALFGAGYLLARRTTPWLLLAPPIVLWLSAGAAVPWLYAPLFQSMNVVR